MQRAGAVDEVAQLAGDEGDFAIAQDVRRGGRAVADMMVVEQRVAVPQRAAARRLGRRLGLRLDQAPDVVAAQPLGDLGDHLGRQGQAEILGDRRDAGLRILDDVAVPQAAHAARLDLEAQQLERGFDAARGLLNVAVLEADPRHDGIERLAIGVDGAAQPLLDHRAADRIGRVAFYDQMVGRHAVQPQRLRNLVGVAAAHRLRAAREQLLHDVERPRRGAADHAGAQDEHGKSRAVYLLKISSPRLNVEVVNI